MRTKSLLFLLGGVFFIVAFLIPDGYFPWRSFYRDFAASLAVLFIAQSAILCKKSFLCPLEAAFLVVVASIPLIQSAFGVIYFWGDGIIVSAYLLMFALAVITGRYLYSQFQEVFIEWLAICLVLAATISSVMALYQWFGLDNWGLLVLIKESGGRPYANLGQPNNLATLLCLGLVSLLYLWERRSVGTSLAVLLSFLLLIGVVLVQSRTSWLMGGVFVVWFIWKKSAVSLRLSYGFIAGFVAVFIALYFCLVELTPLLGLDSGPGVRTPEVDSARKMIWSNLYYAVIGGPWWGYGWNQAGLAQATIVADIQPDFSVGKFTANSHNFFLDLLVWNGPIIGAVLIIGITYWGVTKALSCKGLDVWYGLIFIGLLLVHAMLEYPLEYAYFLFPMGLVVGVVTFVSGTENNIYQLPNRVLQTVVVSLFLGAGIIFYEYTIIQEDSRLMRFETANIGVVKAEKKAPDVLFLTQLREYNRYARTEARLDIDDDELEWMKKVSLRYAFKPALFRYALALKLNGRQEESEYELLRLKGLYGKEVYDEAVENIQALPLLPVDWEKWEKLRPLLIK